MCQYVNPASSTLDFQTALRALHSAAAVSERALAWPYLNCSTVTRLVHETNNHPTLKRNQNRRHEVTPIPFSMIEEKQKCMWTDYMSSNCLNGERLTEVFIQYLSIPLTEQLP